MNLHINCTRCNEYHLISVPTIQGVNRIICKKCDEKLNYTWYFENDSITLKVNSIKQFNV